MPQLCFVSISTTKQSEDRGDSVDENPEKEKSVIFPGGMIYIVH